MSRHRVTETLDTLLRTALWAIAASVIGISAVIMLTMDESSASQGGPFYVAVIAIVVLGFVENQLRRIMRRRLPFSLTTLPAERRYALHALLLLGLASTLLLGLAMYLTAGMSRELLRLVAYVLALAALPVVFAFLLPRYGRKQFERGLDLLLGKDAPSSASRTFTFSFGTPPTTMSQNTSDQGGWAVAPARAIPAARVQHYRSIWQHIRARFDDDPMQAVREAHALILELHAETGHSGVVIRDEQFVIADLAGAASSLASMRERVQDARAASRAVGSALAHESASSTDLAKALANYERVLDHLLGHDDREGGDGMSPERRPNDALSP